MKGRKTSVQEKQIISKHGLEANDYLILKTSWIKPEEKNIPHKKRSPVSLYGEKIEEWKLIHRETREVKYIYIGEN